MKTFSLITLLIVFTQCASTKFENNPPFKITSATYHSWSGGQPSGGMNVVIKYTSKKEIEFDSIYFLNKTTNLQQKNSENKKTIVGFFNSSTRKKDIILDKNPTKELKNEVPNIIKFPFELKEDEAVISYKMDGKTHYFKIMSLQKTENMSYPSPARDL